MHTPSYGRLELTLFCCIQFNCVSLKYGKYIFHALSDIFEVEGFRKRIQAVEKKSLFEILKMFMYNMIYTTPRAFVHGSLSHVITHWSIPEVCNDQTQDRFLFVYGTGLSFPRQCLNQSISLTYTVIF